MKIFCLDLKSLALYILVSLLIIACKKQIPLVLSDYPSIRLNTSTAQKRAKEIEQKVALQLVDGIQMKLWASDSLAPDPTGLHVDTNGDAYVTCTDRGNKSDFDIRGHMDWTHEAMAMQTVEDKYRFLVQKFDSSNSAKNYWAHDLNFDGIKDWQDLQVEKDYIYKVQDQDDDGIAESSQVIYASKSDVATELGMSVLKLQDKVYFAQAPDLLMLEDKNNDGILEKETSLSSGYGVHIGFGGHGMSGIVLGPDGKLYWTIGDIGFNSTNKEKRKLNYPNEGVIVRSDPDGSNVEVFAHGLRNPHDISFDAHGNMIVCDNDGDHPGESERLVHVVEGLDAGWRINWQFGKYTDPDNNGYKVWMNEKLFQPYFEGQDSHILPPIRNFHAGPSGIVFNPGTALGKKWLNSFFMVEFVGSPTHSAVWNFRLKPQGASFEFKDDLKFMSGVEGTAIRFGPKGDLFLTDWLNGWGTKNLGRIWRIDVTENENDLKEIRQRVFSILNMDSKAIETSVLQEYIGHSDQRVRLKAQYELVNRNEEGMKVFSSILEKGDTLAQIHAIWGMGMLAKKNPNAKELFKKAFLSPIPEVQAQTVKTIGEVQAIEFVDQVVEMLKNTSPRVQFYSAEALGKLGSAKAVQPLIDLLDINADQDRFIRHAATLALSKLPCESDLERISRSDKEALRRAAVIILRLKKSSKLELFLNDANEYIANDAARAIHDDLSVPEALKALALMLNQTKHRNEIFLRRALSAAQRVGDSDCLATVVEFTRSVFIPVELRVEAIEVLRTWSSTSDFDRVDGMFRGSQKRNSEMPKLAFSPELKRILSDKDPSVVQSGLAFIRTYGLAQFIPDVYDVYGNNANDKTKAKALECMVALNPTKAISLVKSALQSRSETIKEAGIQYLSLLNAENTPLKEVVNPILTEGTIKQKQIVIRALGDMDISATREILQDLAIKKSEGNIEKDLWYDISEAIIKTKDEVLIAMVAVKNKIGTWLDEWADALFGGSAENGLRVFNSNAAQCSRCHSRQESGGPNVGPNLRNVGSRLDREKILESLVMPSNTIAHGYGTATVKLKDGQEYNGTVISETNDELILQTSDAEPVKLHPNRVARIEYAPSSMPAIGELLTKSEIRDLVEFLVERK
ncbi:MAG: DUF7133 domain-containing protein [Leadbetterella sp.]